MQTNMLQIYMPSIADLKDGSFEKKVFGENDVGEKREFKDRISLMTIGYHNLAVEQEFLKMYPEAA